MFPRDCLIPHLNYTRLSTECQGGQACLDLAGVQLEASSSADSDTDRETETAEENVVRMMLSISACTNSLPAGLASYTAICIF